ncbi:uncharacterized protein MELLADRAFT_123220 [Melampsora larici-populina 98AG31]|uniref:Secreted protein n=1 Tax=Melampsora larici-populina (strain 98AG31 / pathotype 3-4-7) TaxID=747676 RepID=F4SCI4_MELLP|nr:uncharacterized protein MELLADRAFT_123220 [Melampsora larici-populina 98AG31]EGF97643.1 secreted protein [Melampsora larici-populina 98AG31]
MHHLFFNITFLIFSLWIHGLEGDATVWACNGGYSIDENGHGICKMQGQFNRKYQCPPNTCLTDDNQPWVPMSGCVLKHSPIKGQSNQQCATYDYNEPTVDYTCTNSGQKTYVCAGTLATVRPIICKSCIRILWS